MQKPLLNANLSWFHANLSGQSIILILGGLFLLYKSTSEIHHKLEDDPTSNDVQTPKGSAKNRLTSVISQIALINVVFSFDSILTAVGLTQNVTVMILSVVLSIGIMMAFAGPVGKFINEHPTFQMLGLAFLIMIGFMLISEGCHLGNVEIFGSHVGAVPKGYLYFSIVFTMGIELLNMRFRKNQKPIQLRGYDDQAKQEGLL